MESEVFWASCAFFTLIYIAGYWIVGVRSPWKGTKTARHDVASCCMSLAHGTTATVVTAWNIFTLIKEHQQEAFGYHEDKQDTLIWLPSKLLSAPNTPFQNIVMEFSTAYFIVDLLHYALFVPDDVLFILHHLATSTYILSCRYYTKHGALSVMALLGLAESTSFMQNIWTLASICSCHRLYYTLEPVFIPFFTFVRGILGPMLTWQLCKYYFAGRADAVIPRGLAYYWMSTVILAIAGSLFWVSRLWVKLFERRLVNAKLKKLS